VPGYSQRTEVRVRCEALRLRVAKGGLNHRHLIAVLAFGAPRPLFLPTQMIIILGLGVLLLFVSLRNPRTTTLLSSAVPLVLVACDTANSQCTFQGSQSQLALYALVGLPARPKRSPVFRRLRTAAVSHLLAPSLVLLLCQQNPKWKEANLV